MTTTRIELTRGEVAVIDLIDEPVTASYRWYALPSNGHMYALGGMIGNSRNQILLHRLILNADEKQVIGFKDGNPLNCTRQNLVLTPNRSEFRRQFPQDGRHRRKSPYRGVRIAASGRFQAFITVNKIYYSLGTYDTAEEAARAYDEKAREMLGERAILNLDYQRSDAA